MDSSLNNNNNNNDNNNNNNNGHSSSSSSRKPNNSKISDIVSLQRILKKWKRIATATPPAANNASAATTSSSKSIKFIKRTFSFNDLTCTAASSSNAAVVPKGFVAVCVGKELKRYVVPTEHLGHQAFRLLLREAEEEFGFQQEGVLRIPCDVGAFEEILKVVQGKSTDHVYNMTTMSDDDDEQYCHQFGFPASPATGCCSPSTEADSDQYHIQQQQHHHHRQMCS